MNRVLRDLLSRFLEGSSISPLFVDESSLLDSLEMLSGTRPATLEDILHTSPRNVFVFSSFGESFKIEKVREIIAKSTLKTDAAFQVFILVSPELLTLEAANALLKTFEEVPDRTLFLLCGESFEKLPSTLRSRILYLSENRHQYWESPLHTTLVDALCRGDAFPLLWYLQKEKLEKDAYFELLNSIKQRVLDGKLSLSQKTVDKLEAGLVAISSSHANPRFIVDDFVFSM